MADEKTENDELSEEALEKVSGGLVQQISGHNDNRTFTAVSDVVKSDHDTVKNTISNIR